MQPSVPSPAQIASHFPDSLRAAQMNVGSFSAHRLQQSVLVAAFGQLGQLNATAIGRQSSHYPPFAQLQRWIRTTDNAFDDLVVLRAIICSLARPGARGRQQRLDLAGNEATIQLS